MIEEAALHAAVEREFGESLTVIGGGRSARPVLELAAELQRVCLVPARTDTAAWHTVCTTGEVRFLKGRVRFEGERSGAPFPSAVVAFGRLPAVYWWDIGTGELFGPLGSRRV